MLPGERILLETEAKTLRLSTHRIRYHAKPLGSDDVISFMLDEVASCGLIRTTYPWLLAAAALCGVGAVIGQSDARFFLLLVGLVLVVAYFGTRKHVLAIASAGHTIRVAITSMTTDEILRFIDMTEDAKNERYLLHVPLAVTTHASSSSYSPPRAGL